MNATGRGRSCSQQGDASAPAPKAHDWNASTPDADFDARITPGLLRGVPSKQSVSGGRATLPALNGLRGSAALWVVASHLALVLPPVLSPGWIRSLIHGIAIDGYLAGAPAGDNGWRGWPQSR